jgi:FkbM family methyltransferase
MTATAEIAGPNPPRPFLPTAAQLFERLPRPLRRHRLMTGWMRLTGEPTLQLVRIRDASYGYADLSNGFLRLIVIDGDFEADFFAIADAFLGEGGAFFDVGANHGLLSFGLAGRHGEAVAFHLFEPNPALLGSIRRSLERYPRMRCRLNDVAVADREGEVAFAVDRVQSGMSHIDAAGETTVTATTLDAYLAGENIDRVDLLKIDIEGYELPALRGAAQALAARRIAAVYFEYSEKWLLRVGAPADLIAFLEGVGFETCLCRPGDLANAGGESHTIEAGRPGYGVPLRPLRGAAPPVSTDLLAVPKERLVAL